VKGWKEFGLSLQSVQFLKGL